MTRASRRREAACHQTKKKHMKKKILRAALAFGSVASYAQNDERPGPPPPPPIIQALDANGDGVISADEIANAPAALKTLDTNGDGQLTSNELMPGRPPGHPNDGRPHFSMPLIAALDTDTNGILSADEIANASAALKTLDKNGDGQLTPDEFAPHHHDGEFGQGHSPFHFPLLAALDSDTNGVLSADEIANASNALKTLDKNGDGQLSADEYLPPHPQGAPRGEDHPRFAPPIVAALDADGDGIISAAEIANAPAALKTLDRNGDGQLSGDELFPRPPGGPDGGRPRFAR